MSDKILEVLNSAVKADKNAIHALLCNRVPCNEQLADHPTIVVLESPGGFQVGLLGIINGISDKRIVAKWSDDNEFLGFDYYAPPV